tara:strand:- start:71 stop:262 length:192 start_codon:yes stop_codon:yes gene_type:complete
MTDIDKLWQIVDEMLEQQEAARDDAAEEEREWYHDGWVDAMKWLMDVIEEELDDHNTDDQEEW